MENKKFTLFIVFLIATFATAGVFVWYWKQNNQSSLENNGEKVNVYLKWKHNAQFAGMYVAKANNYYNEANLNVAFHTPSETDGFPDSGVEAILQKKADFAVVSAFELIEAVDQKKPVKAVAAIYQTSPGVFATLAEKKTKSPADFANKILGTPNKGKYGLLYYNSLLSKFKIPSNSVSYKVTGFDGIQSLTNGKVDVVSIYRTEGAYEISKQAAPIDLIKPEDYGINVYDDLIITSTDMIKDNPEKVKAFTEATLRGWETALSNPTNAITDTLPFTTEKYKDIDFEKNILSASIHLVKPTEGTQIGMMTKERWQEAYKIYKSNVVTSGFDIANAFTIDFF